MNITEKAAYLKGLAEGLEINDSTKESKLLKAIVDIMQDVTLSIADLEDSCATLEQYIDEIDEDLGAAEEVLYGDEEENDELFTYVCPHCNEAIFLDEDDLDNEQIECPFCGEMIDIDSCEDYMKELDCDDDSECDCGCSCNSKK